MSKQDLLMFLVLMACVGMMGVGMSSFNDYLKADWRQIAECRQSFWTCTAQYGGDPVRHGNRLPVFTSSARACEQFPAYERARKRAMVDCFSNRTVRRGSCREVETRCLLPARF